MRDKNKPRNCAEWDMGILKCSRLSWTGRACEGDQKIPLQGWIQDGNRKQNDLQDPENGAEL